MAQIIAMPKLGFDMAEGTLVRWVIGEGESIAKGAVLAEIETDKATVEVESTYDGIVARHLVKQGDIVPVNTPIAVIGAPGEAIDEQSLPGKSAGEAVPAQAEPSAAGPTDAAGAAPQVAQPAEAGGHLPVGVRISPIARRMAQEHNLDLRLVKGSGPLGRIVRRDVEAFLARPPLPAPPAIPSQPAATLPPAPLPSYLPVPQAADEVVPLNRLRTAIGRRMSESKQQAPHFYVTHEYDMGALLALRQQVNTLLPEEEKVSVNDFIIKACALTLRQFPNLNASFNGDQIVRHAAINIGTAVALESGLLTVICREAERKPLRQVAVEMRALVGRARDGKVRPDDIEGSTFSISNLGMFDVEHFIAIINPPEAAILAVGSARQVPVVVDGEVKPGWRMKATLSVDHRVSDGAEAAQFLQSLALYLEQPMRLLL